MSREVSLQYVSGAGHVVTSSPLGYSGRGEPDYLSQPLDSDCHSLAEVD